ncbi:OLC1v1016102C1 [Oldenlandia corymbosa var. corymbosa]|uniref:OLC1v1016102C1 n=1 Tax=Oldenlandia corymbosa var. corymbosa TaxID=529605 RepID=A0AAV1E5P7_OLDCO|nr:OLC1v1016102C1 [Oldenlandia corymbosa var. corymbosa]
MGFPVGVRFNPKEEELVCHYLKNKILGHPLSNFESQFLIDINIYGANATPWELFGSDSDQFIPWLPTVDTSNKVKHSEENLYVLTKLSSVGKTDRSENKQKSRVAGCGTWHANNTKEPINVIGKNGESILIGYRRNFTFRSPTHETVGQWNMTEYNINPKAFGLAKFNCDDYVLCKIKRDDTKSSFGGKLVTKKRKSRNSPKKIVVVEPSSSPSSSSALENRVNGSDDENVETFNKPTPLEVSRRKIASFRTNDRSSFETRKQDPFTQIDRIEQNSSKFKPPITQNSTYLQGNHRTDVLVWPPKMEESHKEFKKIGFNGGYTLGLMNPRHILIRFDEEDDYQRCWIRMFWNIVGFSIHILKWTPGFCFEEDPPVVPIWCCNCCKIGRKVRDCRVRKPPPPQLNDAVKENESVPKKKVIKLQQLKGTWGYKGRKENSDLDVKILQVQPLIVKAIAMQSSESQPLQSRTLAQTFEACAGGSTSDVSIKVVDGAHVSVLTSEITPDMVTTNHFVALDAIEEEFTKVVDVEGEENVEDYYIEDPLPTTKIQNSLDVAGDQHDVFLLGNSSPLDVDKSLDDGEVGKASNAEDLEDNERGSWSDGDANNLNVPKSEKREGAVHKKHGRKSKDEKPKQLDGLIPRRSLRLQ